MVTKLQEILNYKREEFTFRKNQTNNYDLQSKIDKQIKPRRFLENLNNQTNSKITVINRTLNKAKEISENQKVNFSNIKNLLF